MSPPYCNHTRDNLLGPPPHKYHIAKLTDCLLRGVGIGMGIGIGIGVVVGIEFGICISIGVGIGCGNGIGVGIIAKLTDRLL